MLRNSLYLKKEMHYRYNIEIIKGGKYNMIEMKL